MADTFLQELHGFSGPGQGVIDTGESTEVMLPITDGDAMVTVVEEHFDVTFDYTGISRREVYKLGQNIDVVYPTKGAQLSAYAMALRGDGAALTNTADPDASSALVARETINAPSQVVAKKVEFTFNFWRTLEAIFDSGGDVVTRTVDGDYFGLYLAKCVVGPGTGPMFTSHNEESPYILNIKGVLDTATSTLYRFFNTDLATA